MPAPTTPLATTIEPAPRISGVTTREREARAAAERPASAPTLAMMPTAGDLAGELGIRTGRFAPAKPAAAAAPVAETETETEEEQAEAETEENATAQADADAEEARLAALAAGADADTEEEPKAETEEETEPVLTPEAQAIRDGMQKRIDKLTAQRAELAERQAELENELAAVKAGPRPERTAADPLADILTDRELSDAVAQARAVKDWAIRNPDGGELPGKDGPVAYDRQQVANILANAEATLGAAPQRAQWLEHAAQSEQIGREIAPAFYQKGTPHQQLIDKIMAEVPPAVKAWRPDIKLVLIQAIVGDITLKEKKAGQASGSPALNGGAKPQISAAKVPPAPGGRTAPKAPVKVVQQRQRAQQTDKIRNGGNRELAAAIYDRFLN